MATTDVFKMHEDAVGFCRALCKYMSSLGFMLRTPASHIYGYSVPRVCLTLDFSSSIEYSREQYKTIIRDFVSTTGKRMGFKSTSYAGAKVQCENGDIVDISTYYKYDSKDAVEFNGILVEDVHEILTDMLLEDWMCATYIFDYCFLFKNFNVLLSSRDLTDAMFARMLHGVCWWDEYDNRTRCIIQSMPKLIHNGVFPIKTVWNALDDALRPDQHQAADMINALKELPGYASGNLDLVAAGGIIYAPRENPYVTVNDSVLKGLNCPAYHHSDEFIRLTMPEYYEELYSCSDIHKDLPFTTAADAGAAAVKDSAAKATEKTTAFSNT